MKIIVKTLKGDRFEIQVNPEDSSLESCALSSMICEASCMVSFSWRHELPLYICDQVADVKKIIETVLGATTYPSAEQVLIHKGTVLKDESTVEANNVSEKSIIGVMKRKPASTGTSTSTETPPTEPGSASASYVASERVSESSIQKILGMVGEGWTRDTVTFALYLTNDDIDKALEYLYFDLLAESEDPYITEGTQDHTQVPEEADEIRFFDFLNDTPEDFVEMLEKQDPPLFLLIQDNKALFLRLLLDGGIGGNEMEKPHELQAVQTNEPNNGGDGDNEVGGESKETEVEVTTPEDNELIERLGSLLPAAIDRNRISPVKEKMKINVRTLKGDRFEIQVNPEDSVADVKKNIEAVLGVTAAEQVLIHKGKVLQDETTVEANNVSEKSTIGVMKRNPASTGTSTASASLKRPRELPEQIEDPLTTEVLTQEEADLKRSLDSWRLTPQEPNDGGDSGNQVGESAEETEAEQPQADQTNKPNNGGGEDGGNQEGESEESEDETTKDA
ncbi:Ubiquitin receptor RAD23 [Hirschfeldia incana]|nr:Ubiquitin receptor RAD23 [Hirschfeldia incana]